MRGIYMWRNWDWRSLLISALNVATPREWRCLRPSIPAHCDLQPLKRFSILWLRLGLLGAAALVLALSLKVLSIQYHQHSQLLSQQHNVTLKTAYQAVTMMTSVNDGTQTTLSQNFEQIQGVLSELMPNSEFSLLLRPEIPFLSRLTPSDQDSVTTRVLAPLLQTHPQIKAELNAGDSFSVPLLHEGDGYIASFHAVHDSQAQPIAHIAAIGAEPNMAVLKQKFLLDSIITSVLILLATTAMWWLLHHRHTLARERSQLNAITQSMGEGVCVLDNDGRTVYANRAASEILAHPVGELCKRHIFSWIHVWENKASALRTWLENNNGTQQHSFSGEEFLIARDGRRFPAQVQCETLMENTKVTGTVMVFRDISRRYASQQRNELLVSALDAAASGILITDREGRVEWVNAAFESVSGLSRQESVGRFNNDLIDPETVDKESETEIAELLKKGKIWRGERISRHKDGKLKHMEMFISPVADALGDTHHCIIMMQDITQRKVTEAQLLSLATTDSLTGLSNRGEFLRRFEEELARLKRNAQNCAVLLMLDLDHFKRINDHYGHAAGDAVLRQVADLFQESLRRTDFVGRLGGEEFAMLLPDTAEEGALLFSQRLQQKVKNTSIQWEGTPLSVTVSIGLTCVSSIDPEIDVALARADAALYAAKNAGRDQVHCG